MLRIASHTIAAIVGAALVWFLKGADMQEGAGQNGGVFESLMVDSTADTSRRTQSELGSDRIETLAQELAELELALAVTQTALMEAQRVSGGQLSPRGFAGRGFHNPVDVRPVFLTQPVDSQWAPRVESEIRNRISAAALTKRLSFAGIEVDCRTEVCRVLLTHSTIPASLGEFSRLSDLVVEMARDAATDYDEIPGPIVTGHRTGYTGELTISELFFFRSGDFFVSSIADVAPGF